MIEDTIHVSHPGDDGRARLSGMTDKRIAKNSSNPRPFSKAHFQHSHTLKATLSMAVREPAAGQRAALALPPWRVALPVGWCFSSDGHHGYRHDKIFVLTPRCSSSAQLGDT